LRNLDPFLSGYIGVRHRLHQGGGAKTAQPCLFTLKNGCARVRRGTRTGYVTFSFYPQSWVRKGSQKYWILRYRSKRLQHQLHRGFAKTVQPCIFSLKKGCARIRRGSL